VIIVASYDPADDKLRLRASARLDAETYARVKAAGFTWAPRQDLFVAQAWSPAREDLAIELAGEIGDEDTTLVDRAEERAERFEGYQGRRADEAAATQAAVDALAEGAFPAGSPILVGHHSQAKAEKAAERIESGMRKAIRLWDTSEYWRQRAAGALRHAKYKELPGVRHRRIKGLEAEARKHQRTIDDARRFLAAWHREDLTLERATSIANYDHHTVQEDGKSYRTTLWSMLSEGRMTPEAARDVAVDGHERAIGNATRWLAHLENRLTYERAMLEEAGGVVSDHHNIEVGGRVRALNMGTEEWLIVERVNRSGERAKGPIVSLRTPAGRVEIEDVMGYRPPVDGAAAAVAAATKLPPVANYPSEGCREMTKAEWSSRAPHSSGFYRLVTIPATETTGAHRRREAPIPGGGGWKTQPVYITDAKRVDPPSAQPQAAPAPELAREVVERPARPRRPRPTNPADALREQLKAGVVAVSAPELFPTPPAIAELVVAAADIRPGHRVLEASAGTGAILRALAQVETLIMVVAVELQPDLAARLPGMVQPFARGSVEAGDFMELAPKLGLFDRVTMNPPFSAEIEHVTTAFGLLGPRGRLVAVMSAGVRFRSEKRYAAFRELVASRGGTIEDLPERAFRGSGTDVRTVLVTMQAAP